MAGLVSGDSDSSALTQESGDEGAAFTPRDSVLTGTDVGTDYDEDGEQDGMPLETIFCGDFCEFTQFQANLNLHAAGNLDGVVPGEDEEAQLLVDVVLRRRRNRSEP